MNPTLTKKQFERVLAEITEAAVRPVSKGARASVTVTPGRPHAVQIRIKAVIKHREAVVAQLRSGRVWTAELVKVWPKNVFVGIEPAGRPRLLESGQVGLDLQMTGITVEG